MRNEECYCLNCASKILLCSPIDDKILTNLPIEGTMKFVFDDKIYFSSSQYTKEYGRGFSSRPPMLGGDGDELYKYFKSEYHDIVDFMKNKIWNTPGSYGIKTSLEIWYVLKHIYKGHLQIKNMELDNTADAKNVIIKSISVCKGEKFNDWYDEHSLRTIKIGDACPVCGGKEFRNGITRGTFDQKKEEAIKETEAFLNDCKNVSADNVTIPLEKTQVDVQAYLKCLVIIENNIRFFSDVLKELMYYKLMRELSAFFERSRKELDLQKMLMKVKQNVYILEKRNPWIDDDTLISVDNITKKYALDSPKNIVSPKEPTLKRPEEPKQGIIKTKKSDMLLAQYNGELNEYNLAWETYKKELKEYEDNEKLKEQYKKLLIKEKKNVPLLKEKRDKLKNAIKVVDHKIDSVENELTSSPNAQALMFCDSEIEEVKEKIIELIKQKKQLHSLGVIFPKYLDYVPLVTILEYFESGRCETLKGAAGAYNIYENELRQNIIIDKLDKVISELESIKQNQFLLYTVLDDINNGVKNLSTQFQEIMVWANEATKSLESSAQSLHRIEQSTAAAAYYSAKTAEYTRRNTELTNALGFLIALK